MATKNYTPQQTFDRVVKRRREERIEMKLDGDAIKIYASDGFLMITPRSTNVVLVTQRER